ncbi:hypothetical protein WJX73_006596 [Symbiochloris irregularis]|uniref:Uncharacterized protein n=1 Tax=Symbiochloris irregularis TaxID=706552 RepID=A0AAW1P0N7_9CHLO
MPIHVGAERKDLKGTALYQSFEAIGVDPSTEEAILQQWASPPPAEQQQPKATKCQDHCQAEGHRLDGVQAMPPPHALQMSNIQLQEPM